jgi:cell division protein FtsI/penicillin-binding protein 2
MRRAPEPAAGSRETGAADAVQPSAAHRRRLLVSGVVVTAALAALAWRLFTIQVLAHERYRESARAMRRSTEPILAYRGDISLADGVIVARDVADYEVGIDPQLIPGSRLPQVVRLITEALGKPAEYRRERLLAALEKRDRGGAYVPMGKDVPAALVAEIRGALAKILAAREMKGFIARLAARRAYPRGKLASSVIGVVDGDGKGIEGLEKSMAGHLSRRDGFRELWRDAAQKTRIYQLGNLDVAPVSGHDVHLTISSRTQAIVEEELAAGVEREKAEAGLFILMDVRSGDILAMASHPTYEPERFADYPGAERDRRRANRAIENLHEPGSVIKAFLAAYLLDRGLYSRQTPMVSLAGGPVQWDGGRFARFGRRTVSDVHEHPGMTFEDAIVHSSNIAMAILGLKLGREGLSEVFDSFGLCRPTGICLPAEARGKYTSAKEWRALYSAVSMSFGYEIMVSPIQLLRGFAAVVNGGYLLEPRLVDRVVRDGEVHVFPSRVIVGRPVSEETSRQMREILRRVVSEGTARYLAIEGFAFGGKTGTADMGKGGYTKSDYLASFEAFAPADEPEVAALCMIEKPRNGSIYGGIVAGPVVVEVFRRLYNVTEETKLAKIRRLARN